MGKAPAFQFYANDFMDATSTWEANACGLYIRCLCKQWTHGSIPSDLRILARAIHCDRSELETCWPVLGPKFLDQGDGTLKNSRLEEVRERQSEISSKRSEAGKAGVIAKANAKANGQAKAKQRKVKVEGEVEREVEKEGKERAHEAEIEPTFKQWFDLYAKSRDKEACRAKWTALGQDIHEAIMEHTRRYVVAQPDKLYRKDPIRYLTKRGWEDEIVESKTNGTRTNTNDPDERRRLVIEANAEHFRQQREFEARHQPGGIFDPAHG